MQMRVLRRVVIVGLLGFFVWLFLPSVASAQNNVLSALKMTIRGYVQMNVAWNNDEPAAAVNSLESNAPAHPGESTVGAARRGAMGRDNLRWTAARTRIALSIDGPAIDMLGASRSRGYIELDFDEGDADPSPANLPRLRHSRFQLDYPKVLGTPGDFYVLVGQTTLLLSSTVGSGTEISSSSSGNRGDITGGSRNRVPQVQIGYSVPTPMNSRVSFQFAAVRNAVNHDTAATGHLDSGSRSNAPAVEGALTVTGKAFGRDVIVGGTGRLGWERLVNDTVAPASRFEKSITQWGYTAGVKVPLGPAIPMVGAFDAQAEWGNYADLCFVSLCPGGRGVTFRGTDITATNFTAVDTIMSKGYWAELLWGNVFSLSWLSLLGGYGEMWVPTNDITSNDFSGTGTCSPTIPCILTTGSLNIKRNYGMWLAVKSVFGPVLVELSYLRAYTERIHANTTGDDLPSAGIPITSTKNRTTHTDGVYAIFRYNY